MQRAAYDILPGLLPPVGEDGTPAGSWVVLHRAADTGAYLLAYSWFFDNVVEARVAVAGQPAVCSPDDDPTRFTELRRPGVGCPRRLARRHPGRGAGGALMVADLLGEQLASGVLADDVDEDRTPHT